MNLQLLIFLHFLNFLLPFLLPLFLPEVSFEASNVQLIVQNSNLSTIMHNAQIVNNRPLLVDNSFPFSFSLLGAAFSQMLCLVKIDLPVLT